MLYHNIQNSDEGMKIEQLKKEQEKQEDWIKGFSHEICSLTCPPSNPYN